MLLVQRKITKGNNLMALFGGINKKSKLKASIKQVVTARENEGPKADQLFISAYQGFADVVKGDLLMGDALFNWGFALLHEAKTKGEEDSVKIYLEAISKFTFCLIVEPNHLGAAIDGGVAYMDLSRLMEARADDELYDLAGEFFANAERIQRGSAAYNLACIYALRRKKDACLESLELAKECGSLPSADDVFADVDMANMVKAQWFIDFMGKVTAAPEPEVIDNSVVTYDVEGNEIIKNKKVKPLKYETDGKAYDAEGNILGEKESEKTAKPETTSKPTPVVEPAKTETVKSTDSQ